MKKTIILLLCLTLTTALLTGCAASAEQRTGEAQGYGGTLRVAVSMNGTDITDVQVVSHSETEGVGTRAIDALPDMIVEADSVSVDSVSGATVTSEAIKAAVSQAITGVSMPDAIDMTNNGTTAAPTDASSVRTGVGMAATGRLGPGTDEDGDPVYSFNVVFAHGSFDEEGRVLTLDVDQLEVLSSQFSGFPTGTEGEEEFLSQVTQWTTKGAKGDDYMLGSASWRQQMDTYEDMMTGMTIDEINAWFSRNFDAATGKPVQTDTADATPTDGVTGATMSLRDEHGDILTAIQRAWEDAQSRSQDGSAQDNGAQEMVEDGTMTDTNTEADGESTVG